VHHAYTPDSYYTFLEAWRDLRLTAFQFVDAVSQMLRQALTAGGRRYHFPAGLGERLELSLRLLPDPPSQAPEEVRAAFRLSGGAGGWANHFRNFCNQLLEYIRGREKAVGRLLVFNFREAHRHLRSAHADFARVFQQVPDYFDLASRAQAEEEASALLLGLLEAWIIHPPAVPQRDIIAYIRRRRAERVAGAAARIRATLAAVEAAGIELIPLQIANDADERPPVTIAFRVADPCVHDRELATLVQELVPRREVADWFYLIPTFVGSRFLGDNAHHLSSVSLGRIHGGDDPWWESFTPRPMPEETKTFVRGLPATSDRRVELQSGIISLTELCRALERAAEFQAALPAPDADQDANALTNAIQELRTAALQAARRTNTLLVQDFDDFRADDDCQRLIDLTQRAIAAEGDLELPEELLQAVDASLVRLLAISFRPAPPQ
jgi:hypothetical protein